MKIVVEIEGVEIDKIVVGVLKSSVELARFWPLDLGDDEKRYLEEYAKAVDFVLAHFGVDRDG